VEDQPPTSDTDDPSAKKLVENATEMTIPSTSPTLKTWEIALTTPRIDTPGHECHISTIIVCGQSPQLGFHSGRGLCAHPRTSTSATLKPLTSPPEKLRLDVLVTVIGYSQR